MTVFVLQAGRYEDAHIVGVYATEAAAVNAMNNMEPDPVLGDLRNSADIEEWPVW